MIRKKINDILYNILDGEYTMDSIKGTTDLIDDLGMDSIMLVELSMALESEFDIIISDEDLDIMKLRNLSFLERLCNKTEKDFV